MKWLDDLSYVLLMGAALLMALMPFQPEPHLVEKYHMWQQGKLHRWIDIFDVFWHLLPTALLILKLLRELTRSKGL